RAGKERNLRAVQQPRQLISAEAVGAQQEQHGRLVYADEMTIARKHAGDAIWRASHEETDRMLSVPVIDERTRVDAARRIDPMHPRRWHEREISRLGGRIVRGQKSREEIGRAHV